MDTRGYIDVTELNIRELVAAAFDHSSPQGMGYLHHKSGSITDEEIDGGIENDGGYSYDYVRGRSMKLSLQRDADQLYWHHGWYDHSNPAQSAVLVAAGMSAEKAEAAMTKAAAELAEKNAEYDRKMSGRHQK